MAQERRRRGGGFRRDDRKGQEEGFYEKVIRINRICKTVAGGRRLRFNALIVVGDKKGRVGIGLAKAQAVPLAIDKARRQAMSHMVTVPVAGTTIPDEVYVKFKAARVLLRPVYRGRGIVAGETLRAIAEAAGIKDLVTKVIGRSNPINVAKAAIIGLTQLKIRG
ncbi:MAG: 30S ribosomal protein S5 [bacterium (Candidatus Ratteibacteria) CG23_combo_of_CG06-09_8_20_14_all_48_7]|uniref:Small ribosomal subunit protein uS5 n=1 Tax=bacterium (Candidatus Ratteibacteria) CG23_combo_of_CG06-09_8_20_14_all_48_7 TaxID=2014292 RepID=A0A2G9YBZ4_9BACT|nr:MAG: 30S ribosomal protein S5 [bacterium (Candidatus Ratteibacteria) CG23_combo_of_CG06-09_8_20_14_all_48_7]